MRISEGFAWLGGARLDVLRETPGDVAKHVSMGTVMVGTAMVAAASAAFAMNTAVRLPIAPAVIVGILWGVLILSLDRMLVVSMVRRSGFWANVGTALPRLVLALLIGAVISMPMVLRIFQSEINGELEAMHAENIISNQEKLRTQFADIPVMQARVAELQPVASGSRVAAVSTDPDVKAAQAAVDEAQKAYDAAVKNERCELEGRCGSGKGGAGPRFREAQAKTRAALTDLNAAQATLSRLQTSVADQISDSAAERQKQATEELATLVPALEKRLAARAEAERRVSDTEYDNAGLLARLEALDRLTRGNPMMLLAHLTIFLLFVCIELLPVVAKMLSFTGRKSLYEQLSERRDKDVLDGDDLWSQAHVDIQAMRVQARKDLEKDRLDAQRAAGTRANARLVERQQQIVDNAIDTWAKVAAARSDAELQRWYEQHTAQTPARQYTAPQPRSGAAAQNVQRPPAIPSGTAVPDPNNP